MRKRTGPLLRLTGTPSRTARSCRRRSILRRSSPACAELGLNFTPNAAVRRRVRNVVELFRIWRHERVAGVCSGASGLRGQFFLSIFARRCNRLSWISSWHHE
jgi:hypothetical protein